MATRLRPAVCLALLLTVCRSLGAENPTAETLRSYHRPLMGTVVSIRIPDSDQAARLAEEGFGIIERLERLASPYRADSMVSMINRAAGNGWVKVNAELLELIRFSRRAWRLTEGAFDITTAPLSDYLRTLPSGQMPDPGKIRSLVAGTGMRHILTRRSGKVRLRHQGMAISLAGIVKGYAADRVAEFLIGHGCSAVLVNVGGDIRARQATKTPPPFLIGIENPRDPAELLATLAIRNRAVATSGISWRGAHIIDPRSGEAISGPASVTVLAPNAWLADALATGLFVLGVERGLSVIGKLPQVEALFVDGTGKLVWTAGMVQALDSRCPPAADQRM